ncbi:hypothetical protein RhiirA4_489520 [Rhizophagus irregularis]|uniref:Uncharacterized protein n=1 Tax=Rhizophagus irregularis TaxID=588596 RepID=A0A2I1HUU6_9GLOM|nr:hypothetical protein RhiirA4_489520 [Rhizophagus irregularis]
MGYKILNHRLMLILLIQLFLWVTIINGQFIPGPRSAWVDLNNQVSGQDADMPLKLGHTANVGGPKQDLIFFIGGDRFPIIYQLDTKTNKITSPVILGAFPNRDSLIFMSSVFYEGIIYLFGGGEMDIKTDKITFIQQH